jgi:hypothetical protein
LVLCIVKILEFVHVEFLKRVHLRPPVKIFDIQRLMYRRRMFAARKKTCSYALRAQLRG